MVTLGHLAHIQFYRLNKLLLLLRFFIEQNHLRMKFLLVMLVLLLQLHAELSLLKLLYLQ